jgi:hypothetical protein
MKKTLNSKKDIDELSQTREESDDKERRIQRIEDLPRLEQVTGEIEWVVEGIIAAGAVHMLTSEPGAGKSTLMSAGGWAVSRGEPFLGRATRKRPVLLLDAENPYPAVRERFVRLGISTHDNYHVWGQWVGEDAPAAGGYIVQEWIARCDPKPLIIVDSVIAFHPGAENDSNETRRYMAQYRNLTSVGATVALLHHIGKSETSKDYRGSSDYKASIDIGLKLTNLGDSARLSRLELKPFKQRFSVDPLLVINYEGGAFKTISHESRNQGDEHLRQLLRSHPGVIKSEFEKLASQKDVARSAVRMFLDRGTAEKFIRVEKDSKNRHHHYLLDGPE